ncbi:MAG TPA: 50S ribosomal protein L22 [Actinomycetota bacterium]|nr:50S ribosomal protein L22 [Actinomycetota bacterium]
MGTTASDIARTVDASARYIGISASKVREVAALIKGKPIDEARRILAFTPKEAAREISKILESAIANAEHNFHLPQEELFVKLIRADEGLTMKRFRPRARGRASRIRKRMCSIHLTLERSEELAARAVAPVARRRRTAESDTEKPARGRPAAAETAAPARGKRAKAAETDSEETAAPDTGAASDAAENQAVSEDVTIVETGDTEAGGTAEISEESPAESAPQAESAPEAESQAPDAAGQQEKEPEGDK